MNKVKKYIKEGNFCVCITQKVDNKSFNSGLREIERRTITAFLTEAVNKSKAKFGIKKMILERNHLFIWNSRTDGGVSDEKLLR